MSEHYNTGPDWPQTRAEVDAASDDILRDFMGMCDVEPADFDGCLACYAYEVVGDRETASQVGKLEEQKSAIFALVDTESVSTSTTVKQILVVRKDLNMRKGKMCAQAAHASLAFIASRMTFGRHGSFTGSLSEVEQAWMEGLFTKVCVGVDSEEQLLATHEAALNAGLVSHLITDAGLTEFGGVPTVTCCAIGPDEATKIDPITGALKLL